MPEMNSDHRAHETGKSEIAPLADILKAVGLIGGSLGSLTILFFWLGNAVIVARLRVYNLYGVVRYTDEYVREAGYQLLQDIFMFFDRWEYFLLFILSLALIFLLIPLGPCRRDDDESAPENRTRKSQPEKMLTKLGRFLIDQPTRYILFMLLGFTAAVLLTSNSIESRLKSNIVKQEQYLNEARMQTANQLLLFRPIEKVAPLEFEGEIYRELLSHDSAGESWSEDWIKKTLSDLYDIHVNDKNLLHMIEKFQADFHIQEKIDLRCDEGLSDLQTYSQLADIWTNLKLNGVLQKQVAEAHRVFSTYLSGHLKNSRDLSALVMVPAISKTVNNHIINLKKYVSNISTLFEPSTPEAKEVFETLTKLNPIYFGGALLSFSFWVLLGLLIYLLLNGPHILRFRRWEQVYYVFMALLFVILAVAIPSNYGRYKFEFRVQRLNNIILDVETKDQAGSTLGYPDNLFDGRSDLYVLGPTRGKEIFVGVVRPDGNASGSGVQFIVLDRDTIKSMSLELVSPWVISQVIDGILKQEGA